MVVTVSFATGRGACSIYSWLIRAMILLAAIAALPASGHSAGRSSAGGPNSRGGALQTQVFDPPAAQFSSMWSYGAMSVIAPVIFGDFVPPTAVSSNFGLSAMAPMAPVQGLDPAVSTMLDGLLQQGLLPSGGAAEAEQFGVGASTDYFLGSSGTVFSPSGTSFGSSGARVGASGAGVGSSQAGAASSGIVVGLSGGVPTISGAGALPTISKAGGILPECSDDQLEKKLQSGSEFWSAQAAKAIPVQFPRGVFTGGEVGNPLGGLGPRGNPSNVRQPGPAGSWCRPGATPFSESSPLASRTFWIPIAIVLIALVVFWLSRGMKMPRRNNMRLPRIESHEVILPKMRGGFRRRIP